MIYRAKSEITVHLKQKFNTAFDYIRQSGPTTGPRNNFAQVLSITSSGNFFFEERYDFGTKIGTS